VLLARDPAAHASLDNPGGLASLLEMLRWYEDNDAAAALASRAAAHASLDSALGIDSLLDSLRRAGPNYAAALASRAAANASLDNPEDVTSLLGELRGAKASDAVAVLTARAGSAGISSTFLDRRAKTSWPGREPNGTPSQLWDWQEPQPRHSESEF
jgi:hypothetical protein